MKKNLVPFVLALIALLTFSAAARAEPPMGTWVGDHGSITFTLSADGNYVIPGNSSGTWGWQQTAPNSGILTFTYITHTMTQDFTNHMYFSIDFMDANTATLTDPSGNRDTIRRQ